MTLYQFTQAVGDRVDEQYGLADGDDLCHSLIEAGIITLSMSTDEAARIVAQHMMQA